LARFDDEGEVGDEVDGGGGGGGGGDRRVKDAVEEDLRQQTKRGNSPTFITETLMIGTRPAGDDSKAICTFAYCPLGNLFPADDYETMAPLPDALPLPDSLWFRREPFAQYNSIHPKFKFKMFKFTSELWLRIHLPRVCCDVFPLS
jgi:hypothetical protein